MIHMFTTFVIPALLTATLTIFLIWLARKKDITTLREQANQLRVYLAIIEQMQSTMVLTDLDGNIQYVNPRFTETTGYSLEEVKGKKPSVLKSGHTSPEEYKVLWKTIHSGGTWRGRFHNRKKNGEFYWERAEIFPITDTNGKTIFLAALKEDITQEVLAEEKLQESEERYRLLFENSMDAILLAESDGFILSANPAACKMFQKTEEEICKFGRGALVDVTDPRLSILLEERARTGNASGELTLLRGDGSKFPVEFSSSLFINRDGGKNTSAIIRDITERKRAEEALRESEENYRTLFNHLPIPAFTKDTDGVYTSCNAEELKYWAVSPIGRTDADVLPNDIALTLQANDQHAISSGELVIAEEFIKNTPLGDRIVISHKVPLRNNGGNIVGMLGASIDITERKQAEEALRREQVFNHLLLNASPTFIVAIDNNGKTMMMNRSLLDALGYSNDEILGTDYLSTFVPQEDREALTRVFGQIIEEGKVTISENRIIGKDGQIFLVEWHGGPIADAENKFHFFVGIGVDITARKQMEDALRIAEADYRAIVENAPVGIFRSVLDGRFLKVNRAMAEMYGYSSPEEMLADIKSIPEQIYVDPTVREKFRVLLDKHGEASNLESLDRRKDGSTFWTSMNVRMVKNDAGELLYYEGFVVDVTKRKRAEEREHEQRTIAESLRETAEALNSSLEFDDVLEKILDNVEKVVAYDAMSITWLEEDQLRVLRYRGYMPGQEKIVYEQKFSIEQFPTFAQVVETRQPIVIPDTRLSTIWMVLPQSKWVYSHVEAPIVIDEKVMGIINLDSKIPGFYNETHARNLQIFANQVAMATRNAQLYQEVQRIASYDSLTGIFNRRRFMLDAEKELQRAKRHSTNICFIILDADHFKIINDTFGHLAGDAILVHLARMVKSQIRPYDVVGRYGGEEIVLLLPETSLAEAAVVAERIRQTIMTTPAIHEEQMIACTVSVGVSGNETTKETDLESMLKKADRALYQAKETGRNRVVVSNVVDVG